MSQPLDKTAEEYRDAAHHWQKQWDSLRKDIIATLHDIRESSEFCEMSCKVTEALEKFSK
jgi:hypothetical protein